VVLTSLDTTSTDSIIDNNTIVNPNPDSVRTLIADEIKTYKTVKGDTLASIAKQFNISVKHNYLGKQFEQPIYQPGMDLVILPVDGVCIKLQQRHFAGHRTQV